MRKSEVVFTKKSAINTQAWVAYLRERHPRETAKHVARATDLPVRTVEKWLSGDTLPSFVGTLALAAAYGPELLTVCLPAVEWLRAAAQAERTARLEDEIERLHAELAALGGRP